MQKPELFSSVSTHTAPRHAHQEIADLLGAALCRLWRRNAGLLHPETAPKNSQVGLAFGARQSVHAELSLTTEIDHDTQAS